MLNLHITADGDYGPYDFTSSSGKYTVYLQGDFGGGTLDIRAHALGADASLKQLIPNGSITAETVIIMDISKAKVTFSLSGATAPDLHITVSPFSVY